MKEEAKQIINNINEGRVKIYYQLNQLNAITGLSMRALKYRMITVKEKYNGINSLLYKEGKKWQIHYTIIDEFMPVYKPRMTTVDNHPWSTIVTWNTRDSYDIKYHEHLVQEVKSQLPELNVAYVIEQDGRGINHIHCLTDGEPSETLVPVENVLTKYIDRTDYRLQVNKINSLSSAVGYLKKCGTITIL
ncbi:hypothetical protein [Flavobacterium sp.]|jgi:hypothetical protein|uniref:hypothetical protein n=1 Tax=Flavobacterium sp. TaxID=239 RepID=UPI0037BFAFB0